MSTPIFRFISTLTLLTVFSTHLTYAANSEEMAENVDSRKNQQPQSATEIGEMWGKAASETGKLLQDPTTYEAPGDPNSAAVASAASVNDQDIRKIEIPDADYRDFLATKDLRKYSKFADKRIAVPVFRVGFIVQTKAAADSMAAFDRDRGGARAVMTVTLGGIDEELMQAITDKAYQDYLARLKEAEFDVVPFKEIKATKGYQQIKFYDGDYSKNMFGTAVVVFTPTGMPLFWEGGNPIGNVTFDMGQPYNRLSGETNSMVVLPTMVINFAEMSSSGRSFFANKASVGAEMGITLSKLSLQHMRIGHEKISTAIIFSAMPKVKEPLSIAGNFGEMVTDDSYDDAALVGLLSRGLGSALTTTARETKIVEADPAAYQALVLQALATGNQLFVSALADYKDGDPRKKKKKKKKDDKKKKKRKER